MAGDENRHRKRVNLSQQENDPFIHFYENKLDELKSACSIIRDTGSGYGVAVSKINVCDAQSETPISKATCQGEKLRLGENEYPKGYSITNIFQYGFDVMDAYIQSPDRIPHTKGARLALSKLLSFLSSIGSTEKKLSRVPINVTEEDLSVIFAHHLLSKLTVGSTYILDNKCTGRRIDLTCPCGCGEKISGTYGDTSLGVPSFWYGRVDLITDVAVKMIAPDETDYSEDAAFEMIKRSTIAKMASSHDAIKAGTIVYSYLVKKNHPELESFLIPTIAMSRTHIAVCLYDCENDILLETPLLELFQHGTYKVLSKATVVTLWLALNFKYFCSGVPEEIIDTGFKANFFKHVGLALESYKRDVTAPYNHVPQNEWFVLPKVEILTRKMKSNGRV